MVNIEDDIKKLDKQLENSWKRFKSSKYLPFKRSAEQVGMQRRFNAELLKKFDIPAREKLKQILGDFIVDNPDIYNQDLIIVSDSCKYKYLEIQVCTQWVKKDYPYENIFIYERKIKYGDDTLFLTLNRFLTRGYLFDRESLKGVKPRRLRKYSREFVYDIPWDRAMYVCIKHLDRETIELY